MVETILQPIFGKKFDHVTLNTGDGTRLDGAINVWILGW